MSIEILEILVTCSFSDVFNTYFSCSIALNQYNCCLEAVIMLSNTDPESRLRRMNKEFEEVEPSAHAECSQVLCEVAETELFFCQGGSGEKWESCLEWKKV